MSNFPEVQWLGTLPFQFRGHRFDSLVRNPGPTFKRKVWDASKYVLDRLHLIEVYNLETGLFYRQNQLRLVE